jgi:hypothetical protein
MITREGTQETSNVEFISGVMVWTSSSETEGSIDPEYLLSLTEQNEAIERATVLQLPNVTNHRFLDKRPNFPRRSDIEWV